MESEKTPYSKKLHADVISQFPQLRDRTIQNILDQRRVLFKKSRLNTDVIDRIRREAAEQLGMQTQDQSAPSIQEEQDRIRRESADELGMQTQDQNISNIQEVQDVVEAQTNPEIEEETDFENKIKRIFEENWIQYSEIDPTKRPRLPKLIFNRGVYSIIKTVDKVIETKINQNTKIEELHDLIYVGATTVLNTNNQIKYEESRNTINLNKQHVPPWLRRLQNRITQLRREIAYVILLKNNKAVKNTRKAAEEIIKKNKDDQNKTIFDIIDKLKQKLAVVSNRIRRYMKSNERRKQNNQFATNQKSFYRTIEQGKNNNTSSNRTPNTRDIYSFWSEIWSKPTEHNKKAEWIKEEEKLADKISIMQSHIVTIQEVQIAIKKLQNWKTPGIDSIQNFWLKKFRCIHCKIADLFTEHLSNPSTIPAFFTKGITYLIPKSTPSSEDPSKYRPITCLPAIYKLLTSILTTKIYEHLVTNNILAEEQKGCKRGSRGCKEQLIIDNVITKSAIRESKNLYTCYIDYRKAFDSVPHTWLQEVLSIYKIDSQIQVLLKTLMQKWTTTLKLNTREEIGNIPIKRGIYQGDSLSALWFCLAINPVSNMLRRSSKGYKFTSNNVRLNHLIYMDDLKILAESKQDLDALIHKTKQFSDDIKMSFGLEKCKINAIERGKWKQLENYHITGHENEGDIEGMERNETYNYLGFNQAMGIEEKQTKRIITERLMARVKQLLQSELFGPNLSSAVNTYAIPVITYTFGILKWTQTELENLNRKIRVLFTNHLAHHPKNSMIRFHLPRSEGGRGILDLREQHHNQIKNLRQFFKDKSIHCKIHQAVVQKDKNYTPLNLKEVTEPEMPKSLKVNEKIEEWRKKPIHGRFLARLQSNTIDTKRSHDWLKKANLFKETEGFLMSIQDQVVPTLNYRKYIIKDPTVENDKCRMCHKKIENIDHIISGCESLASRQYTRRHDNVAKIIHYHLCIQHKLLEHQTPYYKYQPKSVWDTSNVKIYWNRNIITDHYTPSNRPDIVYMKKKENITYLIDIAVPNAKNIGSTQSKKIEKYMELAQEIKTIWNQKKVVIIPIVIGATCEIPHKLFDGLRLLNIQENTFRIMQKAVALDTCSIVRKVLNRDLPDSPTLIEVDDDAPQQPTAPDTTQWYEDDDGVAPALEPDSYRLPTS